MTAEYRRQGLPLFAAISVLIGLLVVVQLWLLGAAVGDANGALVAAIASGLLFLFSASLLAYVHSFDKHRASRAAAAQRGEPPAIPPRVDPPA